MPINNNFNEIQNFNYEPTKVIDVNDPMDIYVGISKNGNNYNSAIWQIKRITKISGVWYTQYPNGNQKYGFIWDDRLGYTYK